MGALYVLLAFNRLYTGQKGQTLRVETEDKKLTYSIWMEPSNPTYSICNVFFWDVGKHSTNGRRFFFCSDGHFALLIIRMKKKKQQQQIGTF